MSVTRNTTDYRIYLTPTQIKWVDRRAKERGDRSKVMQDLVDAAIERERKLGGATELERFCSFLERTSPEGCEDVAVALRKYFKGLNA